MTHPLRESFFLDPNVIFLNHGSFGACPRVVFEAYQEWQRRLERQPLLFMRELNSYLAQARKELGEYLHADPDDLLYIPNATHGVNIIARSLELSPGDEILTSDHEYGACDNTWEFLCGKSGAKYIHQPIPLPVTSFDTIVEQFWAGVTPRTKIIYLSHITSPTALRFPVEQICLRARTAGILTLIDGAHAPGQIPLDLTAIGADFYTGNCHKWMMAPKGAGFLYARRGVQPLIEPLVVSWGWSADPNAGDSRFQNLLEWTGTKDPSAALAVPEAIRFMQDHDWEHVRQQCHTLLRDALRRICEISGLELLYPLDSDFYHQMGIAPLPANIDLAVLGSRLYGEFRVEVPLIQWQNRKFVRISVQGYNTQADLDGLLQALKTILLAA